MLEYANKSHRLGVELRGRITSARSSMFSGLMSTTVNARRRRRSRCHKFTRRSSALMYVSQSEFTESELMWYACARCRTGGGTARRRRRPWRRTTARATRADFDGASPPARRRDAGSGFAYLELPTTAPRTAPEGFPVEPSVGMFASLNGGVAGAVTLPAPTRFALSRVVQVEVGHALDLLLENLPQLDRLVVGGDEEPRRVRAVVAPTQGVDLLLDFQRLQVIELWFVRLELGEVPILRRFARRILRRSSRSDERRGRRRSILLSIQIRACLFQRELRRPEALEEHHAPAAIAGREVLAGRVELHRGR